MKTFLKTFLADESGASAAEYALILAVVGLAIAVGAVYLGDVVSQAICTTASTIDASSTAINATVATC